MASRIKDLLKVGQSAWLDYIRRHLVQSGELAALIRDDGVRGLTANPSIFAKAIAGSTDYREAIAALTQRPASEIYEQLAVEDIQMAADLFRPIYEESGGADGFVSLEVSPKLAHDTAQTIQEARRLWQRVARQNLMVKVPGTAEGLPAITALLSEGINVNVTLLFSREVYAQVAEAHLAGLEAYLASGGDLSRIASVASFFVSRIDVAVDRQIQEKLKGAPPALERKLQGLIGKSAVANARLAYQDWKQRAQAPRWQALERRGARPQRLLWASTSTKDPRLSDVFYVESLIGPETVDTIPPATLAAFRDHGQVAATIERDLDAARAVLASLDEVGISLREVTAGLTVAGVDDFRESFEHLLDAIEKQCAGAYTSIAQRTQPALPEPLEGALKGTLEDWKSENKVRRLWARDASLWTNSDEAKWLDWLRVVGDERRDASDLASFADRVLERGITHLALLGMGGSSLCPEVLANTFGPQNGRPVLSILDSTDPAQIRAFERSLPPGKTLFLVSSKSGTTLEPNLFDDYFWAREQRLSGEAEAKSRFVVITDPGSRHLQEVAQGRGYERVFFGEPGIGGRYSALSPFGMVPAALMGLPVSSFLARTDQMVQACASCVPTAENPGVVLGAVLGTLAKAGRDKLTLITSPGIAPLGAWLEQLIAESTGKQGRGIIPVDREQLGPPEVYGADRLFAYIRLDEAPDAEQDAAISALERAGQPVVRLALPTKSEVGQAFFQWEMATAVAGSIIGINAFDQPDVEASKVEARKLTEEYERTGSLWPERPMVTDGPLALYADERNQAALRKAAKRESLRGYLRAHLSQLRPSDYFAVLAYIERNEAHRRRLDEIRLRVRDARRVATCVGFGPRFLHSTGQAYKGGPNTGVFLQLTCDDPNDLPVPRRRYTFGTVKAAQARGDLGVLSARGRRAVRLHLGPDVDAGLAALSEIVRETMAGG